MNSLKIFVIRSFLCLFAILMVGTSAIAGEKPLKKGEVIQIASSLDFPPFEFIRNGEVSGIDIDIANAVADELGVKFEFVDTAFGQIIGALTTDKYQMSFSGFSITEERKKNIDFSPVYYKNYSNLLTKKTAPANSLKELAGKKIGVQTGTVQADLVELYNKTASEKEKIQIVSVDNNSVNIQMLIAGKIDAIVFDELPSLAFAKTYDLHRVPLNEYKNMAVGTAVAFSKNCPYKNQVNQALKKLIKNGTVDKIISKWHEQYVKEAVEENRNNDYKMSLLSIATKGILITLQYTICSVFFSLIMAIILSVMFYSKIKPLRWFVKVYVSIIRGTPMLLQLSCIYFGLSKLLNINLSVFVSGVIAFSINSSAYVEEIIRSGVQSIDKGQFDACKSLNLSKFDALRSVYIPQVLRNIFPALVNEFITLLKDSSLISVFGGMEIMKRTNIVIADYYSYFIPLFVAGVCYYTMTLTLELFSHWWEKRYKY